jgi:hypothetical protein
MRKALANTPITATSAGLSGELPLELLAGAGTGTAVLVGFAGYGMPMVIDVHAPCATKSKRFKLKLFHSTQNADWLCRCTRIYSNP